MEGFTIGLIIMQGVVMVITAVTALGIYKLQRGEIKASTADHSVSAMETVAAELRKTIAELRQRISNQAVEQMETNEEIARLRLDIAKQAAEHQETVNALNKRVQILEGQLVQEQARRERVEEENQRLRDGVRKLEERLGTKENIKTG